MQSVRWRRLAAGLIDFAPFAIALALVTPILLTVGLIGYESHVGVGIFDPAMGGDPVGAAHLNGQRPLALTLLIGALGCVAAQAVLLAQLRGTIGQIVCGILVQRHDGRPASLGRRLWRGSLRQAIALALLTTAVVAARPAAPLIAAEHLALLILALASALALVLVIDLVLALADGRAIGDRLAGTALRPR